MELHILPVLFHFSIFWTPYLLLRWYFKNLLHPDWRWQQRGNVSYYNRRIWSISWAVAVGVLFELIVVTQLLKIKF